MYGCCRKSSNEGNMEIQRRSLGRPARGMVLAQLYAQHGKGNSLTCFAAFALHDWRENIPAMPSKMSRRDRRELICDLARCANLEVCDLMAVVLLKFREERAQYSSKRTAWKLQPPTAPVTLTGAVSTFCATVFTHLWKRRNSQS